ncbi:hypothetical protein MMC11_005749 [Xylographa trunciseda]|nr:hypothetical protein [Xylographa trunciseda]
MYGLSLGVQRINEVLPDIVYALLSGLNASTVGIIALAAVNLADKAITDRLTRILVVIGGSAGLCYNALWYFPILMVIGGSTTVFWDLFGRQKVGKIKTKLSRRRLDPQRVAEESNAQASIPLEQTGTAEGVQKRAVSSQNRNNSTDTPTPTPTDPDNRFEYNDAREQVQTPSIETRSHAIPVRWGISIIIIFFASFIAILVTRGTLNHPPLELKLFANMYLAGTIIFGGGPVVIPLLREYVVEPGWVSSRDFLIGLAIIQAFPGPNFNFAVYLGALALASSSQPTVLGAFLGFVGIFLPGITLALGVQSLWRVFRTNPYIVSLLRGINATAVGLVFTAVYRLWEIGYLTSTTNSGQSLGNEPFWLLIAAVTYAANAWFGVPPAVAIVSGGILGLCWYGAVGR